jgi:hypothetical protein
MTKRLLLSTLAVLTITICLEKSAEAQNYPWCAYYNFGFGGATNCGFVTYQQCLATVRGVGGSCGPSPYPSEPQRLSRAPKRYYH